MADLGRCHRAGYAVAFDLHGPPDGAPLLLLHSLGTCRAMWDAQLPALADRRVLRLDWPGHGGSTLPPDEQTLSLDTLLDDVLAVLDQVGWAGAAVAGLSLGGMVALALAARHPARCHRLVVSNAGAHIADPAILARRLALLGQVGLEGIADDVLAGWFSADFRHQQPDQVALARRWLLACGAASYARCARAVCACDLRPELPCIRCPTTLISGSADRPTPPAWQQAIATAIPGARHLTVPAAHLANLEAAPAYTAALLAGLPEPRAGMRISQQPGWRSRAGSGRCEGPV
jgi:3-oxoadipate enol-lactonase